MPPAPLSLRRLSHWLLALAVVIAATVSAPVAYACACGAMAAPPDHTIGVNKESALILHDGKTETIVISLDVTSNSASAALLLPLPRQAEVSGSEQVVWSELHVATKPRTEYRNNYWPNARTLSKLFGRDGVGGAPGSGSTGGPTVLSRQLVGNLDVVQLSGESDQVTTWLSDNGFQLGADVTGGLAEYLKQGWIVMAAKLAFSTDKVAGPAGLTISFASEELVYPMKLSKLASAPQQLSFFVLSQHRQDLSIGSTAMKLRFAGWLDESPGWGSASVLKALTTGGPRYYLTAVSGQIDPNQITTDLTFVQSASDMPYQEVTVVTVDRSPQSVLVGGLSLLGAAVIAGVVVVIRRQRSRH